MECQPTKLPSKQLFVEPFRQCVGSFLNDRDVTALFQDDPDPLFGRSVYRRHCKLGKKYNMLHGGIKKKKTFIGRI